MVQPGVSPETRTYSDYESVNECMEGVCKIYEEHLKRRNPNTPTITYDISQLFDFVDQVGIARLMLRRRKWFCANEKIQVLWLLLHLKVQELFLLE